MHMLYGSLQSDHISIVFELDLQLVPDVHYVQITLQDELAGQCSVVLTQTYC